jgi:hypothetical protein
VKLAPISGDLLLKAALVLGGLGLLWVAGNKLATVGSSAAAAVGQGLNAVNPLNNDNVIYHTANTWTGGAPDTTLGGRIYDFFNPEPPRNTGGATGSW